jgi:hypothetical protein
LIGFVFAALVVVAAVAIQLVLPGQGVYHAGWYNVALCGTVIVTFIAGRRELRRAKAPRPRWAAIAMLFGTAIVGFAGVLSGLFAPDNQTFVGAPGERIRVESLGTLWFPLASIGATAPSVSLERPLHGTVEVGERPSDAGSFILRAVQRNVAWVEARDSRGNRLTVTQPTGAAFLSPVLLMEHRQTIAGMDLPFDSFNVPAARRVVKAVLFTPAQAATLAHGLGSSGNAAVLFAVDDEKERPLPNAIALSTGGKAVSVGNLSLRAVVAQYPAVEVVAAPNLVATVLGGLVVVGGILALVIRPVLLTGDDRSNVSQDDAAPGKLDPSRG